MATKIRIGHASISENGTANGVAGDSTGKEVCIVENYGISGKGFNLLLRPRSQALAEASALACEAACSNNYIGYSQFGTTNRNTLYTEAEKVNFNLAAVNIACNTDCSAFMTVCAIAGGANITYGENGPTTRTMRSVFGNSGDYLILEGDAYFNSADYLKRGDILVREGTHTIMILGAGNSTVQSSIDKNEYSSNSATDTGNYFFIRATLNLTKLSSTTAKLQVALTTIENKKEKPLTNLSKYKLTYKLQTLNNTDTSEISKKIPLDSSTVAFSLNNLKPAHSYLLKVTITESSGNVEFSSPCIIFTTEQSLPTIVRDLVVNFSSANSLLDKKCTISFKEPDSWGSTTFKKGYRVYLIVNNKVVDFTDNLIKTDKNDVSKTILLTDISKKVKFNYTDKVQVGILPWLKNDDGRIIFDKASLKCSQSINFIDSVSIIDKIYINIENKFKQALLYYTNTRKE